MNTSYPYIVVKFPEEQEYLIEDMRDGTFDPRHFPTQTSAVLAAYHLKRTDQSTRGSAQCANSAE
jgi:hypothetical protein